MRADEALGLALELAGLEEVPADSGVLVPAAAEALGIHTPLDGIGRKRLVGAV